MRENMINRRGNTTCFESLEISKAARFSEISSANLSHPLSEKSYRIPMLSRISNIYSSSQLLCYFLFEKSLKNTSYPKLITWTGQIQSRSAHYARASTWHHRWLISINGSCCNIGLQTDAFVNLENSIKKPCIYLCHSSTSHCCNCCIQQTQSL